MADKTLERLSEEEIKKLKSGSKLRYLDSKFLTYFRDYYNLKNSSYTLENNVGKNIDELIRLVAPKDALRYCVKENPVDTKVDWGYSHFTGSEKLREWMKYQVEYYHLPNENSFEGGGGI